MILTFPDKMEKLPVEMHTEIFSYLDRESLKTSTQVSKNWRSMIHGSSALMRNTKLRVHDFKKQKKFIRNSGRSFRTVCIKNKENGKKSCTRPELLKILRNVANVKNLEVSGDFLGFSERKVSNLELKNLKKLTLTGTANSSRISKILKNVKLQKLTMNIPRGLGKFDKHFQTWLLKQDRLEDLCIEDMALKIFLVEFPPDKLKIQLKKLTIKERLFYIPLEKEADFKENFINFCRGQKNLEEVDMWFQRFWSSHFGPGIFSRLMGSKVLKILKINGSILPTTANVNETLEYLSVKTPWYWLQPFNWQTLTKLSKLKHLDLSFPGSEVRDIIFNCSRLNELITLKLSKFYLISYEPGAFQFINLPSLKQIDLSNIYLSHGDWIHITTKCPLIEKVTLDLFIMNEESAILICETLKNLNEIELGHGIYAENIFPALLKSSSLKELKANEKMKQQLEVRLDKTVIPFKISVKVNELNRDYWQYRDIIEQEFLEEHVSYLDNIPEMP